MWQYKKMASQMARQFQIVPIGAWLLQSRRFIYSS